MTPTPDDVRSALTRLSGKHVHHYRDDVDGINRQLDIDTVTDFADAVLNPPKDVKELLEKWYRTGGRVTDVPADCFYHAWALARMYQELTNPTAKEPT